mmetsp:Transcript_14626/g.15983  ORF Transcript_14626/g.15983 Transcript_14626/m.15983 type:complete len:408 (-) Transcript_14626:56-1279(-)
MIHRFCTSRLHYHYYRHVHAVQSNLLLKKRQSFRSITTTASSSSSSSSSSKANNNKSTNNANNDRLITIRFYRMLQRSCRDLVATNDGNNGIILLQSDIQASDWGRFKFYDGGTTVVEAKELIRLFLAWNDSCKDTEILKLNNWYDDIIMRYNYSSDDDNQMLLIHKTKNGICWTTPSQLREAIRISFRFSSSSSSSSLHDLHGWVIRAIQMLQHQNTLWNQSSVSVTPDAMVRVTATSQFLGTTSPVPITANISSPLTPLYRFAYRIRVENISKNSNSATVQLLGRYWHITEERDNDDDDDDATSFEPIEVDAPYTGAVGQLPVLNPGQVFEYVSGTELTTPIGSMLGHFYMAIVPEKTRSGKSGDNVPSSSINTTNATTTEKNETKLFQATVKRFRLEAVEKKSG